MGERLPRLTAKEIISVLEQRGFYFVRQSGSHKIYRNAFGRGTTVPFHGSVVLHPKFLKAIMKDANISADDIQNFL